MKGTRVAGQHADSAAGYCPSKTLSYSENIMIHLHIFSSQPYAHSRRHEPAEVHTDTHTHSHIKNTPHMTEKSEQPWRDVRRAKMLVGAQSNKNSICTVIRSSSVHRGGSLINMAVNPKRTNPWRFSSFALLSLFSSQPCALKPFVIPKQNDKCFSLNVQYHFQCCWRVRMVEIRKDSQRARNSLKSTG